MKERKMRVLEDRVMRRICGAERDEGSGEKYIMRCFMICTAHRILFG